jgi:hypothetical protein
MFVLKWIPSWNLEPPTRMDAVSRDNFDDTKSLWNAPAWPHPANGSLHQHIAVYSSIVISIGGARGPNQEFILSLRFLASPAYRSYLKLRSLRQGHLHLLPLTATSTTATTASTAISATSATTTTNICSSTASHYSPSALQLFKSWWS